MRFARIFVCSILGCLFGIGWYQLDTSGFFERWKLVSNPSSEIRDLISPNAIPDEHGNPHACDHTFPEFSFPSNSPKIVVRCIQTIVMAADARTRTVYVTDDKGDLWAWSHFSYAYGDFNKMLLFPILGVCLGSLIGVLIQRECQN